jgi:hypothetical protein
MMVAAMGATALSSISALGKGYAGSSLANFQESITNSNTALLRQKAGLEASEGQLSLDQGALQQSRTVASINRTLGSETGKFAASGLNPGYGSPLLLEGFSAGQGATDLALIGAKAEMGNAQALLTSAGTMADAASSAGQAATFGMQATQDVMAGWFGAGTAALQGMSSPAMAPMWSNLNTATAQIANGTSSGIGTFIIPGNWGGGWSN